MIIPIQNGLFRLFNKRKGFAREKVNLFLIDRKSEISFLW
jgi:hypothetical protein